MVDNEDTLDKLLNIKTIDYYSEFLVDDKFNKVYSEKNIIENI